MNDLYPIRRKQSSPEIITPRDYASYIARGVVLPSRAIICPLPLLTKYVLSQGKYTHKFTLTDIYIDEKNDFSFVPLSACGAPALALQLEILIACGVQKCIFFGTAGSLQEEVFPADAVLCQEAFCGDGTSPHYVTTERVKPSQNLLKAFAKSLRDEKINFHFGRHWTTDAVLRETKAEVKHYQKHHVLTVDMEAAAFLAVCRKRGIKGAAAFVVSDRLIDGVWKPDFGNKEIARRLKELFVVARKTVLQVP